jgi:Protein of unknown function (DUF3738)
MYNMPVFGHSPDHRPYGHTDSDCVSVTDTFFVRPAHAKRSRVNLRRCLLLFVLCAMPPLAGTQEFAKVAIKPAASTNAGESRLQILPSGDLIGHAVPAIELISLAYGVPTNPSPRLSSLPMWAVTERFDIEANSLAPLKLDTDDIPAQRRAIQHLVRNLLAIRTRISKGTLVAYWCEGALWCHACCGYIPAPISC